MREEDGTFNAILFIERLCSRSQMFVKGLGRYSVEELKQALEIGTRRSRTPEIVLETGRPLA